MRVAAAMVFGLVLAAGPAKAQEGGILGLFGFGGEDKDAIEYIERPPLVVPKSNVLPPPLERPAKDAAWPRDPDELASKRRAAERKAALKPRNSFDDQLEFIRGEEERQKRRKRLVQSVPADTPELIQPNGEPSRRYLTDPPVGLRAPAPAPAPGTN